MRRPPSLAAQAYADLQAQAPVTVSAITKEITAVKEPLIDRAREAFAAYRGLRRNTIDELISALTVANKEVERLRESNDALLAAARFTVAYYDGQLDGAGLRITMIKLKAAIAKAEELGE